jgi:hypothetical protein
MFFEPRPGPLWGIDLMGDGRFLLRSRIDVPAWESHDTEYIWDFESLSSEVFLFRSRVAPSIFTIMRDRNCRMPLLISLIPGIFRDQVCNSAFSFPQVSTALDADLLLSNLHLIKMVLAV